MIKARIADFPGMRPGNHNVNAIVVTDYRGQNRQVIKSDDVDLDVSFQTYRKQRILVFAQNRPTRKSISHDLLGEPTVTGRDMAAFMCGAITTFVGLLMTAFL